MISIKLGYNFICTFYFCSIMFAIMKRSNNKHIFKIFVLIFCIIYLFILFFSLFLERKKRKGGVRRKEGKKQGGDIEHKEGRLGEAKGRQRGGKKK